MDKIKSVFDTLNEINVNEHTEKKNNLTYLSWAWAWAEVKKKYPLANYTIYENKDGWNYFTDGKTAWVKTGVTIEGLEHIEYLPVMDYKNQSIPLERITSFDVNKAIQRSLTKAVARHGLGLYIYAGEDLPENASDEPKEGKPTNSASVGDLREKARLIAKCTDLGISLDRLATYKGKDKAQLTNLDLAEAIEMKEKHNARN